MHITTLLAGAYGAGHAAGTFFRWILLLAAGASLVRRLVRGSFGAGFFRSPVGTVAGLVVVAIGLIASAMALGGPSPELKAYKRNAVAACVSTGGPATYCECFASHAIRRADEDMERLRALDAQSTRALRANDMTAMPPEIALSVDACRAKLPSRPSA